MKTVTAKPSMPLCDKHPVKPGALKPIAKPRPPKVPKQPVGTEQVGEKTGLTAEQAKIVAKKLLAAVGTTLNVQGTTKGQPVDSFE